MSNYLIGIGGTGAKSVEAAIHLCAAGLMPPRPLHVAFVDPDVSNGNLNRTRITLRQYEACHAMNYGDSPLFSTLVIASEPDVWTPLQKGGEVRPTLGGLFKYSTLTAQHPEAAFLFEALYSKKERDTTLERGFRGHPSIGAAVLADATDFRRAQPWASLRDMISTEARSGEPVRIFLVGSIFGGTGAAGFPTLGRLLRNELKEIGEGNVGLGGVLMLPYFSFTPPQDVKDSGELYASSDGFLTSTKAALKYYQRNRSADTFDAVYLVGDHTLSPVDRFSTGSEEQRNGSHFMELFAAAAARHFFALKDVPGGVVAEVATQRDDQLGWDDIPDSEAVRERLAALARLAHAYLGVYHPALEDLRSGELPPYAAPWYVDFFLRRKLPLETSNVQRDLDAVRDFSRRHLNWVLDIHEVGSGGGRKLRLINPNAITRVKDGSNKKEPEVNPIREGFGDLVLSRGSEQGSEKREAKALSTVWEFVCMERSRDPHADGVGRFVAALHRACALPGAHS